MNEMVEVKIGTKSQFVQDKVLVKLIEEAFDLASIVNDPSKDLTKVRKEIAKRADKYMDDNQTVTFILGDLECKATVGKQYLIIDENVATMKKALGPQFKVLVKHKETYTATPQLVKMAQDDKQLKKLISIKELATTVSVGTKKP